MKAKTKLNWLKEHGMPYVQQARHCEGIHYRRLYNIAIGRFEPRESEIETIAKLYRKWRPLLKNANSNQG